MIAKKTTKITANMSVSIFAIKTLIATLVTAIRMDEMDGPATGYPQKHLHSFMEKVYNSSYSFKDDV